jgi:acyl carrier protein
MDGLIEKQAVSFDDFCQVAAQRLKVDINLMQPNALWVKDIGISSVDIVKIALLMRQKFGIKVTTSQTGKIKTVQDAYQLVLAGLHHE